MSNGKQHHMLAYVYFVAFEPPMGNSSSIIFTLPKPIRETADIQRIEKMLNAGREEKSSLVLMGAAARYISYRVTNISLLEEAEIPLTAEQVAEIKQAREENRRKREAAVEGYKEVMETSAQKPTDS